ncbi:Cyclin-L1 [Trachymyrmex septentrionalis]|uniref:Cyclin-L1 n=1 Tax=Trachymyrmex septentrionalis TaxID=34720 RepID=A0A195FQ01_9HYME|nr:Cyclin-L1 [Trachymyrmex septentrionalis]
MNAKENSTTSMAKGTNASNAKLYGKIVLTLQNCLLPEEKFNSTPSHLDGLDAETETDLRILGCELIQTAGILLKLPQVAMATGQVIFQRFYYSKSLVRHNMETTAMGCICLASKIEEAPRRIRDVINVFNHIKQVSSQKAIQPVILDQNYVALKNQVIKSERRVLKELGFCVHVKHPHKIIVMYLQVLGYEKNRTLMQQSWNYMNDSLRSDVFLRYQPETVACACIYLAARQLQLPLPMTPAWFSVFRVSEYAIRDVCRRILRLYSRPRVRPEQLEKRVEELRRQYEEARTKARGGDVDGHTPSPPLPKHHNAWGGFISRSGTHAAPERTKSPSCYNVQNLQVLPHHEAKKQNIQISEKDIAEVDPEVTVIVDLANPKRLNEDDQVVTSHHEDRVVIDHEVDLGIEIWRNQANIVVNVVDDYTKY